MTKKRFFRGCIVRYPVPKYTWLHNASKRPQTEAEILEVSEAAVQRLIKKLPGTKMTIEHHGFTPGCSAETIPVGKVLRAFRNSKGALYIDYELEIDGLKMDDGQIPKFTGLSLNHRGVDDPFPNEVSLCTQGRRGWTGVEFEIDEAGERNITEYKPYHADDPVITCASSAFAKMSGLQCPYDEKESPDAFKAWHVAMESVAKSQPPVPASTPTPSAPLDPLREAADAIMKNPSLDTATKERLVKTLMEKEKNEQTLSSKLEEEQKKREQLEQTAKDAIEIRNHQYNTLFEQMKAASKRTGRAEFMPSEDLVKAFTSNSGNIDQGAVTQLTVAASNAFKLLAEGNANAESTENIPASTSMNTNRNSNPHGYSDDFMRTYMQWASHNVMASTHQSIPVPQQQQQPQQQGQKRSHSSLYDDNNPDNRMYAGNMNDSNIMASNMYSSFANAMYGVGSQEDHELSGIDMARKTLAYHCVQAYGKQIKDADLRNFNPKDYYDPEGAFINTMTRDPKHYS